MNTETIKACVSALGVLIVACAGMLGFDIDADMVQNGLSVLAFVAAFAYAIWKNHNFTKAAQCAQRVLNDIKSGDESWEDYE